MNLYNEIFRIKELRYAIRNKLISMGLLEESAIYEPGQQPERIITPGGDLEACTTAICSIDGSIDITSTNRFNVSDKNIAKIKEKNLKPSNIKKGVKILGVNGSYQGTNSSLPLTPQYLWNYNTSVAPTTITPPVDSSGYKIVITNNGEGEYLVSDNIANGKRIMGVDGMYSFNEMPQYKAYSYYYTVNDVQSLTTDTTIQFNLGLSSSLNNIEDIQFGYVQREFFHWFPPPVAGHWSPPDNTYYYVYNMRFGKNIYDNNNKFLSMDVWKKTLIGGDICYHIRVIDDNNTPYQILNWTDSSSNTLKVLQIGLTNKQFKLANSHEEYTDTEILSWSNMVRFDTRFFISTGVMLDYQKFYSVKIIGT